MNGKRSEFSTGGIGLGVVRDAVLKQALKGRERGVEEMVEGIGMLVPGGPSGGGGYEAAHEPATSRSGDVALRPCLLLFFRG